ncbi:MAG: 2-oxoacid:acceptor oxidoreductase subunit alpha [Gammaproteobacteria bacterium]|nr:2-oxoacid:acceptor oxidoreductase subunit alpha [Gammaproteobacteria bacterium]
MTAALHAVKPRDFHIVRFAGDSGDGMQLSGQQLTNSVGSAGFDLSSMQDFPAEIRAPAGSTYGVSAFQLQFGGTRVRTPGDSPDVLVAFNPAALKVSLPLIEPGALIIVDEATFTDRQLRKAGFDHNPLQGNTLADFDVYPIDITGQTLEALRALDMKRPDAIRCRNFFALGFLLWTFDLPRQTLIDWIDERFESLPTIRAANEAAVNAGHAFAETAEVGHLFERQTVDEVPLDAAEYRTVRGAEAIALGLAAVSRLADTHLMFCSYPITPASSILHELANARDPAVSVFQAEDEIASCCAAIGASYAGSLGVTSSSGPGIALKAEAIGLGIASELPLLIINSQRAGPSTGLPTKTEQSDLLQALHGRHGDTPLPVVAARSPADCFRAVIDASRTALRHMTPVILLIDGYLTNAAEYSRLPEVDRLEPIWTSRQLADNLPDHAAHDRLFKRDAASLARPWAIPGTHRLMHRIGGLETDISSGHISYDPANHQAKTDLRHEKILKVADFLPVETLVQGEPQSQVLVLGWGSTYGAIFEAVRGEIADGRSVAQAHFRFLHPFPPQTEEFLATFDRILIPEINMGQLATLLRSELPRVAERIVQYNQVTGLPFKVQEIRDAIRGLFTDD